MADLALLRRLEAGRRRSLVTPEGVDLSLRLAEVGERVNAFLIDLLIMAGAMVGLTILCLIGAASLGMQGVEVAAIVWLLGFFVIRNLYFILMEMGPRAATFGKRKGGLRVVARSGDRLTADRVIARNLMREIEFYLPLSFLFSNSAEGGGDGLMTLAGLAWTGIFLFFPKFNKDRMRIGDLLAGTWVISAPRKKLSIDLLAAAPVESGGGHGFTDAQLDIYGVYELQTLERVLRENQPEAIETVAAAIRTKLDLPHPPGGERDFLVAYYDASRARMERGLLFGKRRADKHDR